MKMFVLNKWMVIIPLSVLFVIVMNVYRSGQNYNFRQRDIESNAIKNMMVKEKCDSVKQLMYGIWISSGPVSRPLMLSGHPQWIGWELLPDGNANILTQSFTYKEPWQVFASGSWDVRICDDTSSVKYILSITPTDKIHPVIDSQFIETAIIYGDGSVRRLSNIPDIQVKLGDIEGGMLMLHDDTYDTLYIAKKGKENRETSNNDTSDVSMKGVEFVNPKDSSVLVEVPAGSFTMGSADGESDKKPIHNVYLDKYYISKYEVTVGQFKKFCIATDRTMPVQPDWNTGDNYPVVTVTWNDAKAYCNWAGLRLPTEAEWEKAARGTDCRKYPWGDDWSSSRCNSYNSEDNNPKTSPVGSIPSDISPYGCYDMAGNVWEWCNDWYSKNYYDNSPLRNPSGPSSGSSRVLRGGSWYEEDAYVHSSSHRDCYVPDIRFGHFGFRPAATGPNRSSSR